MIRFLLPLRYAYSIFYMLDINFATLKLLGVSIFKVLVLNLVAASCRLMVTEILERRGNHIDVASN